MNQPPDAPPEIDPSPAAVAATEAIAQLARDLHREPAAGDVLDRIVITATDVLSDIDHAAITVVHGNRRFLTAAASDALPRQVDEIQYATGQGPCLDVLRNQRTYYAADLTAEKRWPAFTRRTVTETDVRSMLSFQLLANDDTLGALNFYGTQAGALDGDELQALCAVFATHAALALARALEHDQYLGMQANVDSSRDINVAIGITMNRDHLDRQAAFDRLRQQARSQRLSLAQLCSDLIAGSSEAESGEPSA